MNEHPVDLLLRLAFLEGHIRTHGAWERAVSRKEDPFPVSRERAALLEERLCGALAASVRSDLLTIGTFLKSVRRTGGAEPEELTTRLGVTANLFRMMEHDRISPLRIGPEAWRKFRTLWNIPLDVFEGMLRRSHQLVFFRPSARATLARYRRRSGGAGRSRAMQQAVTELYARAEFELPPEEERLMRDLLRDIAR